MLRLRTCLYAEPGRGGDRSTGGLRSEADWVRDGGSHAGRLRKDEPRCHPAALPRARGASCSWQHLDVVLPHGGRQGAEHSPCEPPTPISAEDRAPPRHTAHGRGASPMEVIGVPVGHQSHGRARDGHLLLASDAPAARCASIDGPQRRRRLPRPVVLAVRGRVYLMRIRIERPAAAVRRGLCCFGRSFIKAEDSRLVHAPSA
mmetsp:Transcript_39523/g.113743  ORF Transcript_39523/g.113743 Transcript_39523/m.113743 type:complete len:203 (+) Transcript_39523:677-1285(+)